MLLKSLLGVGESSNTCIAFLKIHSVQANYTHLCRLKIVTASPGVSDCFIWNDGVSASGGILKIYNVYGYT